MGLGLAISRSLCELMGHHLDVESVEGAGTLMTVHLGSPLGTWRRITPADAAVIRSEAVGAVGATAGPVVDERHSGNETHARTPSFDTSY